MWVRLLSITILLLGLMLLVCRAPTTSSGPESAFIALEFKSSSGKITQQTLTDTVGKQVTICLIHNLTQYIDASTLKITMGTEFNRVYSVKSFKGLVDTVYHPVEFSVPGNYIVNFSGYIEGKTTAINGILTIVERPQTTQNQKPVLILPKDLKTGVGQEATFLVSATDSDVGQQVTISVVKKPENATFTGDQFKWTPAMADTGSDTVIFTATDNGSPVLSTTDSCVIVVNTIQINRAPKWSITSMQRSAQPDALFSLDLSSYCTDPDNDNLTISILPQVPAKDTVIGKVYLFTPTVTDTGVHSIRMIAIDPAGLTDTITLELTISKTIINKPDQVPPVITFKSPFKDTIINVDSCEVKVTCFDDSGCTVKGYHDGIGFDMKKSESIANLWTGIAKGITAGNYSTIKIVATDSSVSRNKDSVTVQIKYDNDITRPGVTLVKPSTKNTATNASSCSVELKYTDVSGILTVKGVLGTNTVSSVRSGENWIITFNNLNLGDNKIFITATDSSLQANKSVDTIIVNYDPTMLDTIGPTITPVSGPVSGTTVTISMIDIVVNVSDPGEVDSVYWTKNNGTKKMMLAITGNVGQYSLNETLTEGKVDTLTLVAVDKATRHNQTRLTITLKYLEPRYSVSYNGNNNTSGAAPSDPGTYVQGTQVIIVAAGTLIRSGYTFAGWNTAANGSGTTYAAGSTFSMVAANTTFYAQWTLTPTYTVTYNGNGNTGGTAPIDPSTYVQGAAVAVAVAGTLVSNGHTFSGWNTAANGSGTTYIAGSAFSMGTANTTFYAQWTLIPTYTVTYNGNGNTGGTAPIDPSTYVQGAAVAVAAGGALARNGYTFAGWNTAANGSGTTYVAGSAFSMGTANTTFYAQWTLIPTYTVTYNGNGNTGGTAPIDPSTYVQGAAVAVAAGGALARNGYTFAGWNTTANGSGTTYVAGSIFSMGTANTTFYAQWTLIPTYTVTYNGNGNTGGTAPIDPSTYVQGAAVAVAAGGALARNGYSFAGWNTAANGTGTPYAAGSTIAMSSASVELYAQWKINTVPPTIEVGTWGNFARGAVSHTFDDNMNIDPAKDEQKIYDQFGFHMTCFVQTGSVNWADAVGTFAKGHEIANHTVSHNSTVSEMNTAQQAIIQNVPGEKCISIAYPNCNTPGDADVLKTHIAGRNCDGQIAKKSPTNFAQISSKMFGAGAGGYTNDVASLNAFADQAVSSNGWSVYIFHGIGSQTHSWAVISMDAIEGHLEYLNANQDKIWVETFGNIARYIKERDAAKVTITSSDDNVIKLMLTDNLADSIFNYPLSLRCEMPSGWTTPTVTQNGKGMRDTVIMDGSKKYIIFQAVPDNGEIVLSGN